MPLPGDLTTTTVTGTFLDPAGNPMRGTVTITPNATLTDATGNVIIPQLQRSYQLFNGAFTSAPLVSTDNTDINPSGFAYLVTIALQEVPSYSFTVLLPHSVSPVDLSALSPAVSVPQVASALPVTGGVLTGKLTLDGSIPLQIPAGAAAGDVLTSDASGNASWSSVSADGIATTAALAAETSRAETAEALKAPLASPALTGSPTAPTKTALTSNTDIATTAYADSAVAVETSRAGTAEALKAPLASPALTGSPTAPTQTTGDATTKIATDAFVSTAVATETTRAEAAEATLTASIPALPVTIAHGGTGSTTQNFSGLLTQTAVKTSAYSAAAGDFVCVDTTSGAVTVTLPNAPADLSIVAVKMIASAATPNAVTIACAGSDVINKTGGSTSATLTLLEQSSVFQYQHSTGIWLKQTGDVPLGQLDARYPKVFSPLAYGAKGDGTTDDTTALQNCATAATAAGGIIDLGTSTFKTSSAIAVTSQFHLRGSTQFGGGSITNTASDIFTVTGSVSHVLIENCNLTASGGHIWNASAGPNMSFWSIRAVQAIQNSTSFGIWNQTGGVWIDCEVSQNCYFQVAAGSTVVPWTMAATGGVNSAKFSRMRVATQGSAAVPFFSIDQGAHTGWNEEIRFEHITFEVCTGGGIAMAGCVDVVIDTCANWDIPNVRSDTGCSTNSTTTVTDAAAVTGDLGKAISGPGIPARAYITAVSAGTGYTISATATATAGSLTFITGGLAANFYSFTQSTAGYACRNITVRGGRAGGLSVTGSGFNDFFADSNSTNILIDSFGSWATAPTISSPAQQTTYLNQTVNSGSPQAVAPAFAPAGLTGSTSASRYVGATASGAPASGTFATGDFIIDQTGILWICTAGGTHGTWVAASPAPPNLQWFTTTGSNTWTKPTGAKVVTVMMQAGGGGGGSGRRDAAGTVRCGGGGGAGGGFLTKSFDATDLPSTVSLTVGAGGGGGAAVTADVTSGNNGSAGGQTSFGTTSGLALTIGGGAFGSGGTSSTGSPGAAQGTTMFSGAAGGTASTTGGAGGGGGASSAGGGGGSGGGITSGNTANIGGAGGNSLQGSSLNTGAVGVVDGTAPTAGTQPTIKGMPSCGGAGGPASITTAAQAGATAFYGAGGGGGGASLNGNNSGAGGSGGPGFVLVVTLFQ